MHSKPDDLYQYPICLHCNSAKRVSYYDDRVALSRKLRGRKLLNPTSLMIPLDRVKLQNAKAGSSSNMLV